MLTFDKTLAFCIEAFHDGNVTSLRLALFIAMRPVCSTLTFTSRPPRAAPAWTNRVETGNLGAGRWTRRTTRHQAQVEFLINF
jgi:hypothetical protein